MVSVKKGDFVEIEYTGKISDSGDVFDTTDEDVAKTNNLHNPKMAYGPIVICIGEGDVLKGLDAQLEGKEIGKSYTCNLSPELAFGKKDAKLVQLIPTNKFSQNNVRPFPGLQVNIDGMMGLIKTVSGGRTLVDFNHPLSGKEITYEVKLNKVVTDDKEKVSAIVTLLANKKPDEITINDKKCNIKISKLNPHLEVIIKNKVKKLLDLDVEV